MVRMYVVDNDLLVRIGCISLEYLLRLVPSLFDWLTVCTSVERAYTLIKDVHFTKVIDLTMGDVDCVVAEYSDNTTSSISFTIS